MASHQDIANRFADVHAGTADKFLLNRSGNVFVSGDRLYSYGMHFELARFVRPKRGTPFYLLNGDTYSVTTSRHQSDTRAAVSRHADKFESAIVPYSALASAGIDLDSLVLVDMEPERYETSTHRVSVPGLTELAARVAAGDFAWDGSGTDADKERGTYALSQSRDIRADDGTRYTATAVKRGFDYSAPSVRPCGACEGTGRISVTAHVVGSGELVGADAHDVPCQNPACKEGTVTREYGGAWREYDPPKLTFYRNGGELRHVSGDTFEYDTHRHFLGASVFAATVTDYSYRPCRVHADNGRGYCTACGWNVAGYGPGRYSGGNAPMIERKRTRRAYFLSAFDSNESHPHYFLAELPARWDDPARTLVRPTSVADAFRYLMPAKVRDAASTGADVKRQGDVFAIPADDIAARHPIAFRYPDRNAPIPLDGTGRHIVTELVKLTSADGRTVRYFGRGRIVHDSATRSWNGRAGRREHRTVKLDGWHELVRNLVPMSAPNVSTGSGRFGRTAPGIAAPRAWSIIGRVD